MDNNNHDITNKIEENPYLDPNMILTENPYDENNTENLEMEINENNYEQLEDENEKYKKQVSTNKMYSLNTFSKYLDKEKYANLSTRFFAYIIDSIVANSIAKILRAIIPMNMPSFIDDNFSLFVFLIYLFIAAIMTNGSSIGKILFNLKIETINGEKLDPLTIFIREVVGKYIVFKIPILFILAIFSNKNEMLYDIFADTAVINEKKSEKLDKVYESIERI